jgi:hypothetical protein
VFHFPSSSPPFHPRLAPGIWGALSLSIWINVTVIRGRTSRITILFPLSFPIYVRSIFTPLINKIMGIRVLKPGTATPKAGSHISLFSRPFLLKILNYLYIKIWRRVSTVGTATVHAGRPKGRCSSPGRVKNVPFSTSSGPTQSPIQFIQGLFPPGMKQ